MKRREFLKLLATGFVVGGLAPEALAQITKFPDPASAKDYDEYIKDYLYRMRHFDRPHESDVYLDRDKYRLLKSSVKRLKRLQRTIGHGNFYLLSFDEAIKFARSHPRVGRFTEKELDFLEMIFYEDGALYGFFGEKPLKKLTARIKRREVVKIPNTGNYLYKGQALDLYKRVKREIGGQMVLTSGVRSVMKQFLLFLNKAYRSKGNLSMASRSLAPPGYSFHGIGDFDVGQVGFGADNFTERFVITQVYKKLKKMGYIKIRYARDNLLGVRFEPWHIKITPSI